MKLYIDKNLTVLHSEKGWPDAKTLTWKEYIQLLEARIKEAVFFKSRKEAIDFIMACNGGVNLNTNQFYEVPDLKVKVEETQEDGAFCENFNEGSCECETPCYIKKVAVILTDKPEQKHMTLQECKDRVAVKAGFFDWLHLEQKFSRSVHEFDKLIAIYYDEAAELYAQFKSVKPEEESQEELFQDLNRYMVLHGKLAKPENHFTIQRKP